MATNPKTERLAAVRLFANLDKAHLEAIAAIADEAQLEAGREIVTQGSRIQHAYVVTSGEGKFSVDGKEVSQFGPGELIGEISMFDPAPAAATATTTGPTDVLIIGHTQFIPIVRDNPDLAVTLLRSLARRFHDGRQTED